MRQLNRFSSLILAIALLFVLTACSSSLAKPTGLETTENEQQVEVEDEADETGENEDISEDEEASEKETASEDDTSEEDKSTNDEANQKQETEKSASKSETNVSSKSDKSSTHKSSNTEKSSQQQSKKETKSGKNETTKQTTTEKTASKTETNSSASKSNTSSSKQVTKEAKPTSEKKPKNTITISIVISSGEVPLSPTEMEIQEGDTVLDALIDITKSKRIQMDYRGGQGASAYVEGIANVYEFDRGQGSGWMYRINGVFPDRSAGVIPLQDGDRVEWLYTTNLGQDLNADLKPFRR